jgi:hypothetical protein
MSTEKRPVNDYEDEPGKPEGKIDTSDDQDEPASNPVSASDQAQADIKSARDQQKQD